MMRLVLIMRYVGLMLVVNAAFMLPSSLYSLPFT